MLADLTNKAGSGTSHVPRKTSPASFVVSPVTSAGTFDENGMLAPPSLRVTPADAKAELAMMRQRIVQLVHGVATWVAQSPNVDMNALHQEAETVLMQASQTKMMIDQAEQCHLFEPEPFTCSADGMMAHPASLDDTSIFAAPQQMRDTVDKNGDEAPSRRPVPMPVSPTAYAPRSSTSGSHSTAATERQSNPQRARSPHNWPPVDPCVVLVVEFKRQRVRRYRAPAPLEAGAHVLVPGDRGFDCGLVIQCGIWNPAIDDLEESTIRTMDTEPINVHKLRDDFLSIIREASPEEVEQLYGEQASKERLALKTCRELVTVHNLDMDVVDCEYQFDGTKVSFFFEATHSIDFRSLNKDLFRIFNARIWLENVNAKVRNVVPDGVPVRGRKPTHRYNE